MFQLPSCITGPKSQAAWARGKLCIDFGKARVKVLTFHCKMFERPSQNNSVSREKFQLGGFGSDKDQDFKNRKRGTIYIPVDLKCGSKIVQHFC
jgi:hypothetical protein